MTLTKTSEKQIEQLATQAQEGFLDNDSGAFFRRIDWWAFWIVLIATFIVYYATLAPTVTLEDSGELAVASDYLGVPHPPGYPIWTLVTWFFQWIFHGVTYNGHPNPAWSVGLASAVAGAGACGLVALLISRSGADLLRSVSLLTDKIGFRSENAVCLVAGISGGLLLAFSPVLWSQSVIVEVYSLNALFQMGVLLLTYMWMCRPKSDKLLYLAAFLFGLGLTNHQTLLFLGLALMVAVLLKDASLFRDFAITALLFLFVFALAAKGVQLFADEEALKLAGADSMIWKWSRGPDTPQFWVYNYLFLAIPLLLLVGTSTKGKPFSIRLGCSVAATAGIYLLAVIGYQYFATDAAKEVPGFSPWLFNSLIPPRTEWSLTPFSNWLWQGPGQRMALLLQLLMILPVGLGLISLQHGRTVALTVLLAELGVSFYMYLPIASEQNPPMNWGYARTWEGFMHAVTRGQYEAIKPTDVFSEKFIHQLGAYLSDLRNQFTLPIAVLGFLPFCAWGVRIGGKRRSFFPMALGLMIGVTVLVWLEMLGWTGAEILYRLLILPILLMAGIGILTLLVLYLRKQIADFSEYKSGTRIVISLFWFGVVMAALLVAVMSLKAVFPSAKELEEGTKVALSYFGKTFFLSMVFLPPAGIAAIWALSRSRLKLGFDFGAAQQRWLLVSVIGFVSVSVIFLIFQNPQLDIQNLFIGRVQFIQSHALYALWLGYGILLSAAWLERLFGRKAMMPAIVIGLLLPGVLLWENAYNEDQLRIVGGAEQNGHSYGWQFGNWGLQGVDGIKEDFEYWYPDEEEFKAQWDAYPDKTYPPPMTENAIFYGGTDPGRFVPTYMIYSADVRPDVYLITQNALADNTFMNITRDLYGDTIYIPSLEDSNEAFHQYVEDVNTGRIQAGADIKIENGKVSVQGVGGVMTINGILAELIFKENKDRHDFYVEESYVIQWMYPYLTPNGIILKLNKEPLPSGPLDSKLVKQDHDFWGWYTPWLMGQEKFRRDICARKSFSKLRSAIAGIYDYRRMYDEAEYAFKQSIELYPLSPEANFRLAQMYMNMQRFEDAKAVIESFNEQDPANESGKGFLDQIAGTVQMATRRKAIEDKQRETGELTPDEALELVSIYRAGNMQGAYQNLAMRLVNDKALPTQHLLALASLFAQDQRVDALIVALEQYVKREPNNLDVWLDLAAAYAFVRRDADAVNAARQAIQLGGNQAREAILRDPRFQPLVNNPDFRALFPQQAPRRTAQPAWQGGALPNLPGMAR